MPCNAGFSSSPRITVTPGMCCFSTPASILACPYLMPFLTWSLATSALVEDACWESWHQPSHWPLPVGVHGLRRAQMQIRPQQEGNSHAGDHAQQPSNAVARRAQHGAQPVPLLALARAPPATGRRYKCVLQASCRLNSAQPWQRMQRFSPAFCRTCLPGSSPTGTYFLPGNPQCIQARSFGRSSTWSCAGSPCGRGLTVRDSFELWPGTESDLARNADIDTTATGSGWAPHARRGSVGASFNHGI